MAPKSCILPAPLPAHHSRLLCLAFFADPVCESAVSTARSLERPLVVCHLFHGFLAGNIPATERPILDTGDRVAILYDPTHHDACFRSACASCSYSKTSESRHMLSRGRHCPGLICALLGLLLSVPSLGNISDPA